MHANFLPFPAAAFLLAFPGAALAQVVPTTPTKFSIKPVGNPTASTGATINRTPATTSSSIRQITYLTLSPLRQWNSTDGKSLMGKLIAWEETVTTTKGSTAPTLSSAPIATKPTILKDNKVRFLVDQKSYEVPLDRLAAEEQKFIKDLQTAIAAKP